MEIFVTRHGQTAWNIEGRIQGREDVRLNENGIKQAEFIRDSIQNEVYDLIFTSPLLRARETADIINQELNTTLIEDVRIMERSFGRNEGLTKAEIREIAAKHPEIIDVWNYQRNVDYNGIEPFQSFAKRVYEFLDEIIAKYKGKKILIVSHGGVFTIMYFYFKNISLETVVDLNGTPKLKNGEVYKFEI